MAHVAGRPIDGDVAARRYAALTAVQSLSVGHEGQEEGGPEDVLWARQHAANEYTLLLGNGRDLITVDAAVQYRIVDPRAWRYHSQNPGEALRAIAHRAVSRARAFLAAEASFRNPGGDNERSSFCTHVPLASMTVVFGASGTGASPPPPASWPSGSAGRERRAFCCPVPALRSM